MKLTTASLRIFAVCFLSIPASALAVTQTLPWTIETVDFITDPGVTVERPGSLQPYLVQPSASSFFEIKNDTRMHYNLTVTNNTSAPVNAYLSRNVSYAVVWGGWTMFGACGQCWLTSGATSVELLSIPSLDLAPNETRTVTGVLQYPGSDPGWRNQNYCFPGPDCLSDGLHPNQAFGPVVGYSPSMSGPPANWGGSGSNYTIQDNGSFASIELGIRTHYALPLVSGSNGCDPVQANSTGLAGSLNAFGVPEVDQGLVVLAASQLPTGQAGYFLIGTQPGQGIPLGTGQGSLCVGGNLYRWHESLALIPANGQVLQDIAPANMPVPGGITSGSTWYFQLWHRDWVAGASTSNTSNSVTVPFN